MPSTSTSTSTQDSCICIYASALVRRVQDPDHLSIEVGVSHGYVINRPGRRISPMFRYTGPVQFFRHPRRAFLSPDHDEQRGILSTIIRGLQTPFPLQDIHWALNDFPPEGDPTHTLDEIIDVRLMDVARRCALDDRITSVSVRINKLEKVNEFPAVARDASGEQALTMKELESVLNARMRRNVENEFEGVGSVTMGEEAPDMDCPICMLAFVKGNHEIRMPCHHIFHRTCILTWLQKSPTCPLCRLWLFKKSSQYFTTTTT